MLATSSELGAIARSSSRMIFHHREPRRSPAPGASGNSAGTINNDDSDVLILH